MEIISREKINSGTKEDIIKLDVKSPVIAKSAKPGQFVVVMVDARGERVPLTIVDSHDSIITLVFQVLGYTTNLLAKLNPGDKLYSLVGPLGNSTNFADYKKVLIVAGGVGIAEAFPVARGFKQHKAKVDIILGARDKSLFILDEAFKPYSDNIYYTTDNGSRGHKGLVTDIIPEILRNNDFDLVYCVGPLIMMRETSKVTKKYNVKTIVCLNTIMVDGTGMCGSCRLREGGKIKLCCTQGPDFDGHKVDFDDLMSRQNRFKKEENIINTSKDKHE
jgi:ferredoxin--NADP+ reductase